VSCWLALDDAYEANGAMQVIPGSHLKPVWHDQAESTSALKQVQVDTTTREVVELKAGECMIHHCQTLHYTQPNETDDDRRAFIMHYMTPGTRWRDGSVMAVDFTRPLLRTAAL
jgi:ectoine hydroxylase-related dioxygenase (phytanoyl-CoA dioxygenase family)